MEVKHIELSVLDKIKILRKYGISNQEAFDALKKVHGNTDAALVYIQIRGDCLARYKIINGKRILWTEDDYIEEAIRSSKKVTL